MTLRESLLHWAALRAPVVKPSTRQYHGELIEYICRLWPDRCDWPAVQISELDVGAFIPRISDLSSSRYNGIVTMLKATIPTARVLRRRRIQVKERALLSQLEFARLLDALDKRPRSHAGLVIRFLAHTGLRINEARQLKWSDVQADYFLVPASVTKNARVRVIPFVNGIRETLEGLRRVGDGEHILPQSAAKRSLATACKLAGLPRLTHHDFRHLFTTRCIESEVDVGTVARWRGDRDGGAMLLKWYFHLLDPHSRRMAAKVKV